MAANHLRKPIAEVVAEKRTTRQRVHYAIRDGHLNSEWFGAMRVIVADKTYYAWEPNPNRQRPRAHDSHPLLQEEETTRPSTSKYSTPKTEKTSTPSS